VKFLGLVHGFYGFYGFERFKIIGEIRLIRQIRVPFPQIFMKKDAYFTLAAESTGEFKDRGSKFFGFVAAVWSEEEALFFLEKVKKLHPKARHHCYAWRLGLDENRFRANDDGEPSGTAGRPILNQIDAADLKNVVGVVVRYFGGTLLGTSGLINAYRAATAEALKSATKIEKIISDIYRFDFEYAQMPDLMSALKKLDLEIVAQNFGEKGQIDIAIRQSEVEANLLKIKGLVLKKSLEEAATIDEMEGVLVSFLDTR
jgi:uncharacterized YigZ family protein